MRLPGFQVIGGGGQRLAAGNRVRVPRWWPTPEGFSGVLGAASKPMSKPVDSWPARKRLPCILLVGCIASASALTPRPDTSPAAFAGEWAGTGEQASFCYVQLGADGWGWVLVDGGSGDWLGARIQWRNRQQSLQVDKFVPAAVSIPLRILPLKKMSLRSGFNQSLTLTWNDQLGACQLQRIDTAARRLDRARSALEVLQTDEGKR